MTTADKLNYLKETKQQIKQAIIDKGVAISDNDSFRSYAGKIGEIKAGGNCPFHLPEDGTTGLISFDYLCAGYNPVTTTPEALEEIISYSQRNDLYSTRYMFYKSYSIPTEVINKINIKNTASAEYAYYSTRFDMPADNKVLDMPNVNSIENMFESCEHLTEITLNAPKAYRCNNLFSSSGVTNVTLNIPVATSLANAFYTCKNLLEATITAGEKDYTYFDFDHCFYLCSNLTKATISCCDEIQRMDYMFYGCSNLKEVVFTSKTTPQSATQMFRECSSLIKIPEMLDFSLTINGQYLFEKCSSLKEVPQTFDFSKFTRIDYMFSGCSSLVSIENFNTASITAPFYSLLSNDAVNPTYGCVELQSVKNFDFSKMIATRTTSTGYLCPQSTKLTTFTFNPNQKTVGYAGVYNFSLRNSAIKTDTEARVLFDSLPPKKQLHPTPTRLGLMMPSGNTISAEVKKIATDKGWVITA